MVRAQLSSIVSEEMRVSIVAVLNKMWPGAVFCGFTRWPQSDLKYF
jgi:hypothetical protein